MGKRRGIAFLLCAATIAAMFCLPASAADAKCKCGEVLQVWIDGFGQPLYYNEGKPNEREAGNIQTDAIMPGLLEILKGAGQSAVQGEWEPLAAGLSELVYGMLGHWQLDKHGKSVEPIGSHWVIDEAQVKNHKKEPEFWFRYDFRMDPFDIAKQLHQFIEALCKKTGHSKIALTSHSEGSNMVLTYIKVYGTKRLETYVMEDGGWFGLTLAGQLFTKQFALTPEGVANAIADFGDQSEVARAGADLLLESHALDFLPGLGELLRKNLLDSLFENALVPLLCTLPAVWTFIPDEYYKEAIKLIAAPKYDALRAKVNKYHYEVMNQGPAILRRAMKDGVKVAIIASYQYAPIPVTKDQMYQSDRLIDSAREAGGATAAPLGQTLPPSKSKYRSPDGVFDAATCAFPDQTWFVKYNWHNHKALTELQQWLIHCKKQPTIYSNPKFPQYLQRTEEGKLIPLGKESPRKVPENFAQATWFFAKAAVNEVF